MKPLTHEESYERINRAKSTMISVLDLTIRKMELFCTNLLDLIKDFQKIQTALPETIEKKKIFGFRSKPKEQPQIESVGPQFTDLWTVFASQYSYGQPGLPEFATYMRDKFLTKLKEIRNEYSTRISCIESIVKTPYTDMKNAEKNYKQSYSAYEIHCQTLNDLFLRNETENSSNLPAEIQQKIRSSFNTAKSQFSAIQDNAVLSLEYFNRARYDYHIAMEKSFEVFEDTEIKRENDIQSLFTEFFDAIKGLSDSFYHASTVLEEAFSNDQQQEEDLSKFSCEFDPNQASLLNSFAISLPFDITQDIDPHQIFQIELSQDSSRKLLKLKNDIIINNVNLRSGEVVLQTNSSQGVIHCLTALGNKIDLTSDIVEPYE